MSDNVYFLNSDLVEHFDLDRPFVLFELKKALEKLKKKKAPGVDAIPSEFFKNLNNEALIVILDILNRIFEGEGMPDNFTEAIVFPLFKKGDLSVVANFRGISFLSSMYKIYTQMLLGRIQNFVNKEKILHESQAGFRQGYSTIDHIFTLNAIVEDNLKNVKGKVFVFFIDFSAAFDTVNRDALILKLQKIGISSKITSAISAIYKKTVAKVWTKQGYTNTFDTKTGVRQGCLLSPLLFTIYLNDLIDYIDVGGFCYGNVCIRMLKYADDIVFLASDPVALQQMINKLSDYCIDWDLKVNLSKSKIMVFRKGGPLAKDCHWEFRENPIEVVKTYKYLGVNFVTSGKIASHLEVQLASAKLGLNTVHGSMFYAQSKNIDAYFKVFDAVSRSIICYACQVWGYQRDNSVEKLQRFFIKKLFKLPYNTPNYMLLLELGRDPIFIFTLKLHWSFVLHTLKLPDSRFSKILFKVGIQREHNWYKFIKNLAIDFNFWDDAVAFDHNSANGLIENLFLKVKEKEYQDLLDQVMLGQFHPLYKEIKTNWGRVQYFSQNFTLREMRYIMMARTEMLPLNWKPWYSDSNYICSLCNLKENETVAHFILKCPVFREFRRQVFNSQLEDININEILNGNFDLHSLAKFISIALNYRTMLVEEFNF